MLNTQGGLLSRRVLLRTSALLAGATLLAACAPSAPQQAAPAAGSAAPGKAAPPSGIPDTISQDDLVAGARKEGALNLYTSMSTADAEKIIPKFEAKYQGVKVNLTRGEGEAIMNRAVSEALSNRFEADVLEASVFDVYGPMKEGLLAPWKSAERASFPEASRDPDGQWTAYRIQTYVISYNKQVLGTTAPPTGYEDLLDPRFKGKIAVERDDVLVYMTLADVWGREKAKEYFTNLQKQDLTFRVGHTLLADLLVAGEFAVSLASLSHTIAGRKAKNAPVDWVKTDPVITNFGATSVAAKAPHPYAARLWNSWLLSADGQQNVADLGRIVPRPGIKLQRPELVEGVNLKYASPTWAPQYDDFTKEWNALLKIQA